MAEGCARAIALSALEFRSQFAEAAEKLTRTFAHPSHIESVRMGQFSAAGPPTVTLSMTVSVSVSMCMTFVVLTLSFQFSEFSCNFHPVSGPFSFPPRPGGLEA